MHYVDKLDFFDVEFMQNPCIKGEGAPTTSTEADVGFFYMNTLTGDVYKCIAVADGNVYTWEPLAQSSGGNVDLTGVVKSIDGITPDENGEVSLNEMYLPRESFRNQIRSYATERWVQENYLTRNELIEPLYVAVTMVEDGHWECDIPYSDILQAYNEDRPVYCHVIVDGTTLRLSAIIVANDMVSFAATSPSGHTIVHINSDNVVLVVTVPIPTKPEDIGAQPAGDYLTEVPDSYAKTEDIPTKPEDIGAQPAGNYLTEHQSLAGYATENYVKNQIAEAELSGGDVDLSGYATKDELPTKVSHLQNDSGYLTAVPDGYAKTSDIPTKPSDIGAQPAGNYLTEHQSLAGYAKTSDIPTKVSQLTNDKGYLTEHQSLDGYAKTSDIPTKPEDIGAQPSGNYALKTEIPNVPVQSVNGKTGAVQLSASDVGALPSTYTPPNQTAEQVGADSKGTAASTVSQHNTADDSHNDIRLELKAISDRLTAFFDSDNQTLDELSEIVTYITNNKSLIDSITTNKVSVADIVNNLTSNVTNKPLSAAQGVALKSLIDGVSGSLANYQPKGNYLTSFTETDPTVPSWAKASSKPSYSKSEVGLGNVDNVKQYSASNPPPYPVTSVNGETGNVQVAPKFDPTVYGLPVLYLTGDTSPIAVSKDNKVTLDYVYGERSGTCTLKGQGATSYKTAQALVNAGKKGKFNYTIKFDTAFEAKEGWGAQQKYCLKANFIDTTHSRNICSCKLWGMSVKARSTVPSQLANLPNGGAVDGFPIIIMLNGEFHGLYTWNIPKDGWMFGLVEDTTKTQAIVGADDHTTATQFKEASMTGFEVEFVSDEDNAAWVETSLTRLISAVMNSNGSDLDTTVAQYLDWDSAIDHYIHTVVDKATDCVDKNYLLVTFDGVKWYMSAYDRDSIHGLNWDASGTTRPVSNVNFIECAETVRIYELIKRFKTNALKARYKELRGNVLSESRIMEKFENFAWAIPSPVMQEDVKLYPTIKGSGVNTIDQIGRFVRQRLVRCDEWIDALPAQETPVEPEKPVEMVNQVPISTDTDGSIYNGTGYKDNARLSSSGGVSGTAQTGSVVTGFIPYAFNDVIRIKGAEWLGATTAHGGHWYLNFYNTNKTLIENAAVSDGSYVNGTYEGHLTITYDETTGVTTFKLTNPDVVTGLTQQLRGNNAAYFRINAYGKGADLIITVNQEITV